MPLTRSGFDRGVHSSADSCWVRVGGYSKLPPLIVQLGTDPDMVLDDAGLPSEALASPDNCIPYSALARLLHQSATTTGHQHLGMLAGRMWKLADLGTLAQVMLNCETVGDSLRQLTRYQHLNCHGGMTFIIQRGGVVDLGYAIYDSATVNTAQLNDAALAAASSFMRELCGNSFAPTEVYLPHVGPEVDLSYRNAFRVRPHFNAEYCTMRFPSQWLNQPVAGADPAKRRYAQQILDAGSDVGFLHEVTRALRLLLLNGKVGGDDLARVLSMHRRTLNRQLQARGTTFQRVLDQVRFTLAGQLLRDSQISLDELAATLGYASVTPFMRTFQRWSGTTPGRWRRKQRDLVSDAICPAVETRDRRIPYGRVFDTLHA